MQLSESSVFRGLIRRKSDRKVFQERCLLSANKNESEGIINIQIKRSRIK